MALEKNSSDISYRVYEDDENYKVFTVYPAAVSHLMSILVKLPPESESFYFEKIKTHIKKIELVYSEVALFDDSEMKFAGRGKYKSSIRSSTQEQVLNMIDDAGFRGVPTTRLLLALGSGKDLSVSAATLYNYLSDMINQGLIKKIRKHYFRA